jgi:hypothetical protein
MKETLSADHKSLIQITKVTGVTGCDAVWLSLKSRRHPERSRSSGEARDLPCIATRGQTKMYEMGIRPIDTALKHRRVIQIGRNCR